MEVLGFLALGGLASSWSSTVRSMVTIAAAAAAAAAAVEPGGRPRPLLVAGVPPAEPPLPLPLPLPLPEAESLCRPNGVELEVADESLAEPGIMEEDRRELKNAWSVWSLRVPYLANLLLLDDLRAVAALDGWGWISVDSQIAMMSSPSSPTETSTDGKTMGGRSRARPSR